MTPGEVMATVIAGYALVGFVCARIEHAQGGELEDAAFTWAFWPLWVVFALVYGITTVAEWMLTWTPRCLQRRPEPETVQEPEDARP